MARRLDEILKSDPNVRVVRLEYEGLADLTPLMPVLSVLPNLIELDLRGNKLEALPRDMSSLRNVKTIHLQQNLFRSASDVLPGLESMPALTNLDITLASAEEEERVLISLAKLQVMNGAVLTGMDDDGDDAGTDADAGAVGSGSGGGAASGAGASRDSATAGKRAPAPPPVPPASRAPAPAPAPSGEVREIAMTEDDLEAVALLYGAINALGGPPSHDEDNALTEEFEQHIQTVMRGLGAKLEGVDDPFVRQGEILAAKHDLYDICFQKSMLLAGKSSQQFGQVLRKLRDVHKSLFSEFPGVLRDMRPHYTRALEEMKDEVSRAHQETGQLLEAAEALEQEAAAHSEEKERLGLSFQKERQRLLAANKKLQQEAAELQARLRQYESGTVPLPSNGRRHHAPAPSPAAAGAGNDAGAGAVTAPVAAIADVNVRNLTLKQLKEVIESIYASKVKFDKKCSDAHLPRETMEQHMYTYLNQKYGLRTLIVEHASSVHRAVKRYSGHDNDVAVFGLVLRNEIDEEFRYVQKQLKETVADLLRVYLKGKFPLKTDDAINDLLAKRLAGHVYEEEWVDIIKYMYNHEDSLALIVMVNDLIQATQQQQSTAPAPRRRRDAKDREPAGPKGRVRFKAFLKVLLDFQLKGHQRFLAKFHAMFCDVDRDANGVVDEDEFRQLVQAIDPSKADTEVDSLVNLVDPYDNQHITFSECVSVLSAELVRMMAGGQGPRPSANAG